MSNQVYFGKCINSARDAQVKEVTMVNMPDKFNEGDLLAVFFTNRNVAATPSIKFVTESTQQEVSVADDEGILIKSYDVDVEKEGLWGDGETVLFCFVKRPNENTNTQNNESEENESENVGDDITSEEEPKSNGVIYLEIIGKLQASKDDYGIVKLESSEADNLANWVASKGNDDDKTTVNTATIKALMQLLFNVQESSEETPQPLPMLSLNWEPVSGEDLTSLGDLSLTNGTNSVSIQIPSYVLERPEEITHTGQLINNGNGGLKGSTDDSGDPYITHHISTDLFFIPGDEITPETSPRSFLPGNGIALENSNLSRTTEKEGVQEDKAENLIPYHIRFDKDKLVLGYNGGENFNKVLIRPALNVEGAITTTGAITCGSNITANTITGTNLVSTNAITEKNELLQNRYSGKLKTITLVSNAVVINVKRMLRIRIPWPSNASTQNWKPIGVVGHNVDAVDTNNNADGLWSNIWELFVIGSGTANNVEGQENDIQVAITNVHPTKSINVKIRVRVLCVRTDI